MVARNNFFLSSGPVLGLNDEGAGAAPGTVSTVPVATGAAGGTTGVVAVTFGEVGVTGGVILEFLCLFG